MESQGQGQKVNRFHIIQTCLLKEVSMPNTKVSIVYVLKLDAHVSVRDGRAVRPNDQQTDIKQK